MGARITGLAAVGLALAADQFTKAAVLANAEALAGGVTVVPGFDLVLGRNDGVAFGLLGGVGPWVLVVLAAAIVCWLATRLFRSERRRDAAAYGAVIGGALGNVADRLRHGAVTDFLDFYVGDRHWPAFNLADVAVVCGFAAILLLERSAPRRSETAPGTS